eukprot:403349699
MKRTSQESQDPLQKQPEEEKQSVLDQASQQQSKRPRYNFDNLNSNQGSKQIDETQTDQNLQALEEEQQNKASYIDKLKLDSFEPLLDMADRKNCPKCNTSRKYYCYECYIALNDDPSTVPRVQLPVNVTVIRHPKEKISKSSIVASKLVAQDTVEIKHEMLVSELRGDDEDYDSVVLLFPTEDAIEVTSMNAEELAKIKKVVIIDCTWHQTAHFLKQQNLKKLKTVKILTEKTVFWRYQRISESNLATIEALYYFFRDFDVNKNCQGDYSKYDGKYDNLLYYYVFNYKLIQFEYKEGQKKDRNFWKIKNYIKNKEEEKKE